MGKVVAHVADALVEKGYDGAPRTKFKEGRGDYGTLNFKVSVKQYSREQENKYDKYSVMLRGVKKDSKIIDILNKQGTRICIHGELSQEEFNGRKFLRIICEGRNNLVITKFGEDDKEEAPTSTSSNQEDDYPAL